MGGAGSCRCGAGRAGLVGGTVTQQTDRILTPGEVNACLDRKRTLAERVQRLRAQVNAALLEGSTILDVPHLLSTSHRDQTEDCSLWNEAAKQLASEMSSAGYSPDWRWRERGLVITWRESIAQSHPEVA